MTCTGVEPRHSPYSYYQYRASIMTAVGITFNVFSYDAVWAEQRASGSSSRPRIRYQPYYDRASIHGMQLSKTLVYLPREKVGFSFTNQALLRLSNFSLIMFVLVIFSWVQKICSYPLIYDKVFIQTRNFRQLDQDVNNNNIITIIICRKHRSNVKQMLFSILLLLTQPKTCRTDEKKTYHF